MSENNIPHIVDTGASIMPHEGMKPLSDQEIIDCVTAWAKYKYQTIYVPPTDHQIKNTIEMARVIEKAHGIE
jgi:hypothetical protein